MYHDLIKTHQISVFIKNLLKSQIPQKKMSKNSYKFTSQLFASNTLPPFKHRNHAPIVQKLKTNAKKQVEKKGEGT